ncbi:hypothetical protein HOE37_00400 [Candidatus Woesearchaeota archaeon]|jgi:NOL1/NOP2/fmu family ribosome biogenesis protein|nr:hypothetical protein [Candidatus Woesearchaeota archaeon]MBT4110296.1 hypothetical protein [Candidatus Woesearchaeota archaeon]MBT4336180.1 hypothetical protein [Candidatus Woesearchaeota archaeon]MBT4468841.1 hypothetical protein [Candidatus Woesearchaeota archaeon]MBT6744840.1 hypothetical protein [Candidatus Woesearchaeota archaeon]
MQKLIILNTRKVKKIKEILIKQFGFFPKHDYAFLQNEKNRIFMVNKDFGRIDLDKLRIDRFGLYFAEHKDNHVRLSKEGAQFLARMAKEEKKELENVFELDEPEMRTYFKGQDLIKDLGSEARLILLKYKKDIFGCAKYKEGKILNFLPKIHRGEVIL